jgi:hypothetical protein
MSNEKRIPANEQPDISKPLERLSPSNRMKRLEDGTKVRVIGTDRSDVHIGDYGKINGDYGTGYGVDVYKWFPAIVSHDRGKMETRCVFKRYDQVEAYEWPDENRQHGTK